MHRTCARTQAVFYGVVKAQYFSMYAASFRMGAYFVGKGEMTPIDVFRCVPGVYDNSK